MLLDAHIATYFSGQTLYGNDFKIEQLKKWYEDEAEGYSDLVAKAQQPNFYVYHELNKIHGFRHEQLPPNFKVLGIGSAYCEEFLSILSNLAHITALDPSEQYRISEFQGVPVSHMRPSIEGNILFVDDHFDIITRFAVLHHIVNVSFVLGECHRVLKPGGVMFCREPIVTMGDWRKPRRGATKNERGMPFDLFTEMVNRSGFAVSQKTLFDFVPLVRFLSVVGLRAFAHKSTTILDYLRSKIFAFNKKYHRIGTLEKFGPTSLYLILHKKSLSAGI